MTKKLIINADDYGICPEVNTAIENLIKSDRLKNVSVLANSKFYAEAVDFLLGQEKCSVGVHLNIVEGVALLSDSKSKSLLGKDGKFLNLSQLFRRWVKSPFTIARAVEWEWRTQIELLLNSGLTISHADSHQHIHAFPPFWKILIKICSDYEIPAVRLPRERNEITLRQFPAFAINQSATISKMFCHDKNLLNNQHFLGFKRAGTYGADEMINDLRNLKAGLTELIVHPSMVNGVPYPSMNGKREFEALNSSKLFDHIAELKIELLTWSEFSTKISKIYQ